MSAGGAGASTFGRSDLRIQAARSVRCTNCVLQVFSRALNNVDQTLRDQCDWALRGAGLRTLTMYEGPMNSAVTLRCPVLGALYLKMRRLNSIQMDDGLRPPLRSSLVDFLSHPGASRLRRVVLPMFKAACQPAEWSDDLAEALSGLPRLTDLVLQKLPGNPFHLACPQLRRLTLRERPRDPYRALVVDCPRLEECWVPPDSELVAFHPGTRLSALRG
ncbi:hypothetical protein PAPYR_7288 [Paratrimastix pyriformis]|uniref:Uncharacterized protein n=1 Tax=Paratrimastix pyriformis TaxID=342808 RepID=A0ABQ8UIN6_9EUKA|nr:hypothetical protein PAPYR_7288 [Paratrimastix pyriformis]